MFFIWLFIIVVCFLFSFGSCIFDKSPEEYDTWDKDPIDYNINSVSSSVKDTTVNKPENKNKENVSPEKAGRPRFLPTQAAPPRSDRDEA